MDVRIPNRRVLYEAIFARRSTRSFVPVPLDDERLHALRQACNAPVCLASGARVVLVTEAADRVFPRLVIKGAPAFLATIGYASFPHVEEAVGFLGEYLILTATASGMGTCWVAGTFRRAEAERVLALAPGERLYAVSPLGQAGPERVVDKLFKLAAGSARRKHLAELVLPGSLPFEDSPRWMRAALEAARLAPSARNRQPWRFALGPGSIEVTLAPGGGKTGNAFPQRLDCGIAMLHLELGAASQGAEGVWTLLDTPAVGLFTVN